jgi:hypothetical protein
MAYGILTFLYCLLLQRSTVDKFQDFLQLFQLFSESHGGRLIEKTVITLLSLPQVDTQQSVSRAKKVRFLTTMVCFSHVQSEDMENDSGNILFLNTV